MFAIAFDLTTEETARHHPKGVRQAYTDIETVLVGCDFSRVQGSLFTTRSKSLVPVYQAITELKKLPWFPQSVRDMRVSRVEEWSDFTATVKNP